MKSFKHLAIAAVLVTSLVSCKKTEEATTGAVDSPSTVTTQEIAGTSNPNDLNPIQAQSYIDSVTIGHEVGADGAIPTGKTGDDFAPGQPVHIAMQVKDAPANAAVKVLWFGPGEAKVGEEQKNVPAGAKFMTFNSPTTGWGKGDYRAEVWIGDEKVNTQQFQIVDAANAGK
ncbi:MAG TPA: hypothetical protein VNM92_12020 [Thermoanaerobaculia bacterium]|nr:hypothetical protein [Thermoanaerobaculia bacterium]